MYTYIIVDDESLIRKGTIKKLSPMSDLVQCIGEADEGQAGIRLIEAQKPDFVILDMQMPGMDGTQLLGYLSEHYPDMPLIVISGFRDFDYIKTAISADAIDYILKPFEPEELLARMEVILRRTQPKVFTSGSLTVDSAARKVTLNGNPVPLTATEFDLLALLTANAGAALSRDKILAAVWGWDYIGETRTVDVHVQHLRSKLGTDAIETVYKYGYRWSGGGNGA